MPPEIVPSDEEYASSEDSDFAPDTAPPQDDAISSDESEAEGEEASVKKPKKRKRVAGDGEEVEDAGFENSGDEAVIEKGLKRRKKGKKTGKEEDEGGEGGLIKTRSMRAQEKVEMKPLVTTASATVDVDALWQSMISNKPLPTQISTAEPNTTLLSPQNESQHDITSENATRKEIRSPSTLEEGPDSMIMIKRTYKFAGKVHTEQKLVHRNSAEAKLYLESQPAKTSSTEEATPATPDSPSSLPKRPPKKARRSVFEPSTEHLPQRTDLHFGVRKDGTGVGIIGVLGKEKKLNTVEKSAMDWAGFVDKEGIKDELDAAGKSKGAYKARQEFLARVEEKRDEDERRMRGL